MPGNRTSPGSREQKVKGDAVVRVSRYTTLADANYPSRENRACWGLKMGVVWGTVKEDAIEIGNCHRCY